MPTLRLIQPHKFLLGVIIDSESSHDSRSANLSLALDIASSAGLINAEIMYASRPERIARRKKYPILTVPESSCLIFMPKKEDAKESGIKTKATKVNLDKVSSRNRVSIWIDGPSY